MRNGVAGLRGIVTVLNTPFTPEDQVDLPALVSNIECALAAGVTGFLIPAMASEVTKLSPRERTALVETTLATVKRAVPVIGGASSPDSAERLRIAKTLIDLGCDGVLASIPYKDSRDYMRQVAALAELAPGFLMLQDWDSQGFGLPVPLIVDLFQQIEPFQSIKIEVVPAGIKYSEVLQATHGELHVTGGWAVSQMIEALDRGVHALMPTGMHALYTRIYALYSAGERSRAQDLFYRMLPILAFSNQHLDISIHFFKRLLYRQGFYRTDRVRQPIQPFDPFHARIADELIDLVIMLTEQIEDAHT